MSSKEQIGIEPKVKRHTPEVIRRAIRAHPNLILIAGLAGSLGASDLLTIRSVEAADPECRITASFPVSEYLELGGNPNKYDPGIDRVLRSLPGSTVTISVNGKAVVTGTDDKAGARDGVVADLHVSGPCMNIDGRPGIAFDYTTVTADGRKGTSRASLPDRGVQAYNEFFRSDVAAAPTRVVPPAGPISQPTATYQPPAAPIVDVPPIYTTNREVTYGLAGLLVGLLAGAGIGTALGRRRFAAQITDLNGRLTVADQARQAAEQARTQAQNNLTTAERERDDARNNLTAAERDRDAARNNFTTAERERNDARNNLAAADRDLQNLRQGTRDMRAEVNAGPADLRTRIDNILTRLGF